jgi:predicted SprT family Zn-dependent metalloprotease
MTPRLREVAALARALLAAHGLAAWSFGFNRRKRALGMCFYERRAIELSTHFAERNGTEAIRDTLLHEIAHALVGHGHGHDAVWRRKCLAIGARPERCSHSAVMPEGRWQARCGGCGRCFHRHRKPLRIRSWFCLSCGERTGKLVWRCA